MYSLEDRLRCLMFLLQTFLIKKTREDFSSSITSELVTNSTEKRLFNKAIDLELEIGDTEPENVKVGEYILISSSDAGISFDKIKEDKIEGIHFSKVIKEARVGEMVLSFNTTDHILSGVKLQSHEVKLNTLTTINEHYPKEILFLTVDKKSLITINQVKSGRRKRVDINILYSQRVQMNDSKINFSELVW